MGVYHRTTPGAVIFVTAIAKNVTSAGTPFCGRGRDQREGLSQTPGSFASKKHSVVDFG